MQRKSQEIGKIGCSCSRTRRGVSKKNNRSIPLLEITYDLPEACLTSSYCLGS